MRRFQKALTNQSTDRPPFWFMRQAGRYLPEYMAVRTQAGDFLSLVYDSEKASEVTIQPIRRYDMDAAIIFCDILVIPQAMGQKLWFEQGHGPRLEPLSSDGIKKSMNVSYDQMRQTLLPVFDALQKTRTQLNDDKDLIGFIGAPWTLACYMFEGRGSGDFWALRQLAYQQKNDIESFLMHIADLGADFLIEQIENGASAVQIFDSWAAHVPNDLFTNFVIKPHAHIAQKIRQKYPDVPVIGFPRGCGAHIERYAHESGVQGVSVDANQPFKTLKSIQKSVCVQGNLDPAALRAGGLMLDDAVKKILDELSDGPFIFNLAHGIHKDTDPENVAHVAEIIKSYA